MRLLCAVTLFSTAGFAQSLWVQAEQAHSRGDLKAEKKLLAAAAETGTNKERVDAECRLALLAWRFELDDDSARAHFQRAMSLNAKTAEVLSAQARFESARGKYDAARALARNAMRAAATERDRETARIAFAIAAI